MSNINLVRASCLLAGVSLLAAWPALGQKQTQRSLLCDCEAVKNERRRLHFYTNDDANKVIHSFTDLFAKPLQVSPRPYACESFLYAMICQIDSFSSEKFIFYDPTKMASLKSEFSHSDNFLLAHEIAHHVLGHTTQSYYFDTEHAKHMKEAMDSKTGLIARQATGKNEPPKTVKYLLDMPRRHIHELEADALALWMTMKKGLTENEMDQVYEVIPRTVGKEDIHIGTATHPSPANRVLFLKTLTKRFREKLAGGAGYENVTPGGSSPFYKEAESFYAFQLLTASEERASNFNQIEKMVRDSLNRRAKLYAELVAGGSFLHTDFRREGTRIPAIANPGFTAGLKIGVRPWYKQHRFETDIKFAFNTFSTYVKEDNQKFKVEQFRRSFLQVQPRYVFSKSSKTHTYNALSAKWMATAGVSSQIPVTDKYESFLTGEKAELTSRYTLSPLLGAGFGISNWNSKKGHFNLWALYIPHQQSFDNNPTSSKTRYTLHTFATEIAFRFW